LARLLDTASKFALFSVSSLKDEKLIKKQTYRKTETCKLYSRLFWTFLPNVIKINPYNLEPYRFKVGAFFLRHSVYTIQVCQKSHAKVDVIKLSFYANLWHFIHRLSQNNHHIVNSIDFPFFLEG